jgi:hypothetical protein
VISAGVWNEILTSSTSGPITREAILGFIIGYLAIVCLFELWTLYTEWALEFERNKARIYFEEKRRAEYDSTRGATNFLTLEGRTDKASG